MVTLRGDHTANVQNHVEEESKLDRELVPIHHQALEERTAVNSDRVLQAENATIKTALVRCAINCAI